MQKGSDLPLDTQPRQDWATQDFFLLGAIPPGSLVGALPGSLVSVHTLDAHHLKTQPLPLKQQPVFYGLTEPS